ncbi:MAG: chemotaxis protein CheW [Chloroflexi bacterium]|nr:chemotaxis protein CheW [Chloroflexota bacterium]
MDMNKQLSDALVAHRKWKDYLMQAVQSGQSDYQPAVVRKDNQCDFGKWLHHDISNEIRQSETYQTVLKLHASFHFETARILELALSGRKTEAEQALGLGNNWRKLSAELTSQLLSWRFVDTSHAETSKALTSDKLKMVWDARAKALTQSTNVQTGEMMQVVVFMLANETYGIATEFVKEVQPLRDLTPVPCTPDFVVGVINIRGSIYSVIDIRSFFNVPPKEISELTKVILVNAGGLEVGILADDVSGATSVQISDIKPPLAAQNAVKDEYIQGVTPKMLIILNLEALLRDDRIIVHQEVS